jgi:hypothetical protein
MGGSLCRRRRTTGCARYVHLTKGCVTSVRPRNPYGPQAFSMPVHHCDHDTFHSGQGRYSHDAGELRYVLVCDECQAEIRLVHAERYRPNFDPTGSERQLKRLPG